MADCWEFSLQAILHQQEMSLIKKGSKLYSIAHQKCPRCQTGELFTSGVCDLKRCTDMPAKCEYCGQYFELEPSFYSGAMYVSYALQVALFATVYVALRVLFNPSTEVYIYTTITSAVILFPLTLRLSRSIYINFFVSYDDKYRQEQA